MAEAGQTPQKANPVPYQGDHDRIAMLSLNADGTANQHNPEVILSPEAATEASTRQFQEQAVSAVDTEQRIVATGEATAIVGTPEGEPDKVVAASELPQDPSIEAATKEQIEAAQKAGSAAKVVVSKLTA